MTDPKPHPTTSYCKKTRKRSYKKSTKGCKDCKTRKIKCDEKRPICGNCTRRYVGLSHCEYVSNEEGPRYSAESNTASCGSGKEILPLTKSPTVTPIGLGNSDTLQLRLMYHYTKSTCGRHIISTVPILPLSLWEVEIPQIAFSSELVLNALMGISALHLLSMNPQDRSLASASGWYLGKALKEHRTAMETMDLRNPEELIFAAVLIAHHHWLSASTKMFQEPYMNDMGTYRFCQGIQALVARAAPWLLEADESSCVGIDKQIEYLPFPHFLESASDDTDNLLRSLEEDCASQEAKDAYDQVAVLLKATYSRIAHGSFGNPPIEQDITAFLPHTPQLFIEHLEKNKPLAMAMLARNIALLSILPDSGAWWIHGAGQCKMADTTVHGICGLMPPQDLWMMDWPLKLISGEITLET
ncbi:hypothetical protein N431DRAFT_480913 [Stipitochalara longipes BDJ]|nr:hypothetical protein N431DRAFT_480913 [Stipitochalara longipes BDJ]